MATPPDRRPYASDDPTSPPSLRRPASLTATAWSPCAELAVADWVRQGRWLGALGRGSGWWIGDWVRYGNARYGDRYGAAARVTGYDQHSLRNMAYVAGRFEVSRRRAALSFSHHAELAALPAEEQELWLDRAESEDLSLRSLRSEMRTARRRAASRVSRAEARRQGHEVFASVRRRSGALAATESADAGHEPQRTASGSSRNGGRSAPARHATLKLVCPECGCHFAASAEPARRDVSEESETPFTQPIAALPERAESSQPRIRRVGGNGRLSDADQAIRDVALKHDPPRDAKDKRSPSAT
jgi:hypothetical protein